MKKRTSFIIQMHEGYEWAGAAVDIVDFRGWNWYFVSAEVAREVHSEKHFSEDVLNYSLESIISLS